MSRNKPIFESIVDEFDCLWESGQHPEIQQFVDSASLQGDDRLRLLKELICIDIEYRWQSDNELVVRKTSEDYLSEWPELNDRDEFVLQMIDEEVRAIHRSGAKPNAEEFEKRFGGNEGLWSSIQSILAGSDFEGESKNNQPPNLEGFQIIRRIGQGGMG